MPTSPWRSVTSKLGFATRIQRSPLYPHSQTESEKRLRSISNPVTPLRLLPSRSVVRSPRRLDSQADRCLDLRSTICRSHCGTTPPTGNLGFSADDSSETSLREL